MRPLVLIGAAAVAIGVFLPWLSDAAGSGNGFDVPLAFLWSLEASEGLKLGVVMLLVAGAAIGLSFVPGMGPIRRILGAGASVAALAFVGQVYRAVDRFGGGPGDVFDTLGVAVYVTFVGGMLLSTSK